MKNYKFSEPIEYGGIYWVVFDPSVGHEYKGKRPAVVIQSDLNCINQT